MLVIDFVPEVRIIDSLQMQDSKFSGQKSYPKNSNFHFYIESFCEIIPVKGKFS